MPWTFEEVMSPTQILYLAGPHEFRLVGKCIPAPNVGALGTKPVIGLSVNMHGEDVQSLLPIINHTFITMSVLQKC